MSVREANSDKTTSRKSRSLRSSEELEKANVLEGFSNNNSNNNNCNESKDMNDIIVYLMTCIFVLLLVDYIFKMGKNSY